MVSVSFDVSSVYIIGVHGGFSGFAKTSSSEVPQSHKVRTAARRHSQDGKDRLNPSVIKQDYCSQIVKLRGSREKQLRKRIKDKSHWRPPRITKTGDH